METPRILSEIATGWQYISGIPTFDTSAVFSYQIEMTQIADYFLRSDRVHTKVSLVDTVSNGVSYSTESFITQPDIGVSFYYYSGTNDPAVTSTALFDGTGLVLSSNPGSIQFKDFTVPLNSASDVYTEDFGVQAYSYNLFGTSTRYTGGYTGKTLRIDTKSINNTSGLSKQVVSGSGQYPVIGVSGAGGVYSHSDTITTTEELQLVNGRYRTVSSGGYADYTNLYVSGSPVLRDYTGITATSDYRYVTFKYTGLQAGIPSGETREKIRVTLNSMTGLTVNMTTPDTENHRFHVRVVDIGDGTGINDTTTVGWMDACNVISPVGLQDGANGTRCLNQSTSTNSQRDITLRNGTTENAVIYFRIGVQNNISASLGNLTVVAVSTF
jgi:hypothetical protein